MHEPRPHAWPIGTPSPSPRAGTVGMVMSSQLVTIDAGVSLEQALGRMDAHAIHHLLVTDRNRVVAVVSDRDLQRGLGIGPSHRDEERHRRRPLFQVANYRIVTIEEDATLTEAAAQLLQHHVSALPVTARRPQHNADEMEEAIVGIVTSRDLLRYLADEARAEAPQASGFRRGASRPAA